MSLLNGSYILTNYGETLRFDVVFANTDLTDATARVAVVANTVQANPDILGNANVQVTNATAGAVSFELDSEDAGQLFMGKNNWFRLEVVFEDGTNIVTPQMWINVE